MPSFTLLMTCTPLNLPMASYLYALIFLMIIRKGLFFLWESFLFMRISSYLWSSVGVFSFYENLFLFMIICENLFCLWESLLIYDHLWKSFPFMRIFLNLFLFMIICENLFLFMINYFITYFLSHLPICGYLFSSSFIIHAFILISMNWKSSWT